MEGRRKQREGRVAKPPCAREVRYPKEQRKGKLGRLKRGPGQAGYFVPLTLAQVFKMLLGQAGLVPSQSQAL